MSDTTRKEHGTMKTRNACRPTPNTQHPTPNTAFTLIELLVVIAIISILAAILFPVFAKVRESTRQGSAMSNMHAVYLGARLFYEDEGRYPTSLFGYAEVPVVNATYDPNKPTAAPARPGDTNITPMSQATGNYYTDALSTGRGLNHGYLYGEQVKDFETFLDSDNLVGKQQNGQTQVTAVVYPKTLPTLKDGTSLAGLNVVWTQRSTGGTGCPVSGDTDYPTNPNDNTDLSYYNNQSKLFYKMDSMDIGPAIDFDASGNAIVRKDGSGNTVYELHYSPDWTKERYDGKGCDAVADGTPNGKPIVSQLKYKSPPTERTILTYNTDHVATAGSSNVLILLMSGTARTMDVKQALKPAANAITLPLNYK